MESPVLEVDNPTFPNTLSKTINLSDYGSGVQYTAGTAPAVITFNSRGFVNNAVSVSLTNNNNSATYQVSILTSGVVSIN